METFSALLALCKGNPLVTCVFSLTKAGDVELWSFLWFTPEQTVDKTIEIDLRMKKKCLIHPDSHMGVFKVLYQFSWYLLDFILCVRYFIRTDISYLIYISYSLLLSFIIKNINICQGVPPIFNTVYIYIYIWHELFPMHVDVLVPHNSRSSEAYGGIQSYTKVIFYGHYAVSNHQQFDSLVNSLTGRLPSQISTNVESIFMPSCHHEENPSQNVVCKICSIFFYDQYFYSLPVRCSDCVCVTLCKTQYLFITPLSLKLGSYNSNQFSKPTFKIETLLFLFFDEPH